MDIDKYTSAITDSVISAAELGDEQTRRTAAALATAIAAPVRLAVLAALSDMANEISDELGDRTVTVRLDGTDAVLAVHSDPAPPHVDPTPSFEEMTGDISRVTHEMESVLQAMRDGDLWGFPRLEETFRTLGGASPDALVQGVLDAVRGFMGDTPQHDDMTVVALQMRAGRG